MKVLIIAIILLSSVYGIRYNRYYIDKNYNNGRSYYSDNSGQYIPDDRGKYIHDPSGNYIFDGTGIYAGDNSGAYHEIVIRHSPKDYYWKYDTGVESITKSENKRRDVKIVNPEGFFQYLGPRKVSYSVLFAT